MSMEYDHDVKTHTTSTDSQYKIHHNRIPPTIDSSGSQDKDELAQQALDEVAVRKTQSPSINNADSAEMAQATMSSRFTPCYSLSDSTSRSYAPSATSTSTPVYSNYAPPPLRGSTAGSTTTPPVDAAEYVPSQTRRRGRRRYTPLSSRKEGCEPIDQVMIPTYEGYEAPSRTSNLSSDSDDGDSEEPTIGAIVEKQELPSDALRRIRRYEDKLRLARHSPIMALEIPSTELKLGRLFCRYGHVEEPMAQKYMKYKAKREAKKHAY